MAASAASAHKGPPFPIVMDSTLGDYVVSVWADPDIGQATFYIIVESPDGGMPSDIPHVALWTEPVSGRLERATWEATQQDLRNQLQFEVLPYFDQGDIWNVGIQLVRPGGDPQEVTAQVESTPPGYGPWDLVIYIFPFVFLAGFWAAAMVRRSRALRRMSEPPHAAA